MGSNLNLFQIGKMGRFCSASFHNWKKGRLVGYILSCTLFTGQLKAQEFKLEDLQQQVISTVSNAKRASVLITDFDKGKNKAVGGRFSGVVVSDDGIILTVAHASTPLRTYQVTFADGTKVFGKGLGRISSIGVAMIKIEGKGKWPGASIGSSASLKVNEPCLSIAFPGSYENMIQVARFGYIGDTVGATHENRFRTTCLMEPGDSGGPVFNISGQLIGLSNNIDRSLDNNFEVPIDLYKKYWNALLEPVDYDVTPIGVATEENVAKAIDQKYADVSLYGNDMVAKEQHFNVATVKLTSKIDGKTSVSLGTVIVFGGKKYILSKYSSLGDEIMVEGKTGEQERQQVVFKDKDSDILLISANGLDAKGINIGDSANDAELKMGQFLCSELTNGEFSWSATGSREFDLEAKFRAGYSGIQTEVRKGKLYIDEIIKNDGNCEKILKVGDEILAVDGKNVSTQDMLLTQIRKHQPGDVITVRKSTGPKKELVEIKLGNFPIYTPDHPASFFEGGRSKVRDGFNNVYIHDGRLMPAECGGAVFDIYGNFVGINIARYSRIGNVLLSVKEIKKIISRYNG